MAPKTKINLKDRCENGELDLSMSDLQEVPVKEIATMKKATNLDLSNNRLTTLGRNFISLTHILKLDLSKNLLQELPEDFGEMKQLRHLDLYSNKITHIPLSFSELKSLRWLDLKNNPLIPAVAKIAGPCLDAQQCQQSAKAVVAFFTQMQTQVEEEKERREVQKQLELEAEALHLKTQQKKRDRKKAAKAKAKKMKYDKKDTVLESDESPNYCEDEVVTSVEEKKKTVKQTKRPKFYWTILYLKSVMYLTFASGLLAFILSAAGKEPVNSLRGEFIVYWKQTVYELPTSFQGAANIFGDYVKYTHSMTGRLIDNISLFAAEVGENQHVNKTIEMFSQGFNVFSSECIKLLRTLSDKAIILSDEIRKKII